MHITQLSRIAVTLVFISLSSLSFAQLQPASFKQKPAKISSPRNVVNDNARMGQCGPDTVYYAYAKATSLQGLNINNTNSASKIGQWFDAPQQIMLYGFTFFAWVTSVTPNSVTLTCSIVLAGTDSLPTGPVVATTTVQVDTSFSGGSLAVLEKTAMFTNPVLIDYPYVVVIETSSPLNVALVASDWDSADGGGEWLGMANIPTVGWRHGYNVNVGGVPFDADFIVNPIVTYNVSADFTADTTCVMNGGTVDFTNSLNSPALLNKFYNQYAYDGSLEEVYVWNYDDGSPLDLLVDTTHTFAPGLDYDVSLRARLQGWFVNCEETHTVVINPFTASNFTFSATALSVQFTNASTGYVACLWDLGDGGSSTNVNPSHSYTSEGDFEVTLVAVGECSSDTFQTTVSVCSPLSSAFTFNTSGLSANFSVTTITGSASFTWDYGDGATGSGVTASHTYNAPGAYSACLFTSSACTADTACQQIVVLSTGIVTLEDESWDVFPNPAKYELVLFFRDREARLSEITLFDAKGAVVQVWHPSISESRRVVLPIPYVPEGTYYLVTQFMENRRSGRVVVVR